LHNQFERMFILKSKVAYLVKPRQFEIREEDLKIGRDQILIKMATCALCNYELNHWEGLLGNLPMQLGHEGAGTVVEVGEDVLRFEVGDKVTGPTGEFSEYNIGNDSDERLNLLTDNIDPKFGFSEPLKCVTTVLRSTVPEAGDFGVVVGCGPMGIWCIQGLCGNLLSGLIAVDVRDENLEMAKKYGATHTINSSAEDAEARIKEITSGHMADFVIEGTGIPNVVEQCMNYLRSKTGRLVVMSSFKKSADSFDLRLACRKGLRMICAHGSDSVNDDWRRSAQLINNGTFQSQELVTHTFRLEDINTAFEMLENKPKGYLKGMIIFD